jgi:hypothetical protein
VALPDAHVADRSSVSRVARAGLFSLVGVLFFGLWWTFDPSFEESASQTDWLVVIGFSTAILLLAVALPFYAQLVGNGRVVRLSCVPSTGAAIGSIANVLEDGFAMGWAFWGFILGAAILNLGLLALTLGIALLNRGAYRLAALVPAVTSAAILLYVVAGGVLMLVAWLPAAALALLLPTLNETKGATARLSR